MRKLFAIILTLASFGFVESWLNTSVKAATNVNTPQVRIQIGQRRRWRQYRDYRDRDYDRDRDYRDYGHGRTTIQTRLVQFGWHTYRETYQVRYLPDGRVETNLISRVRVS